MQEWKQQRLQKVMYLKLFAKLFKKVPYLEHRTRIHPPFTVRLRVKDKVRMIFFFGGMVEYCRRKLEPGDRFSGHVGSLDDVLGGVGLRGAFDVNRHGRRLRLPCLTGFRGRLFRKGGDKVLAAVRGGVKDHVAPRGECGFTNDCKYLVQGGLFHTGRKTYVALT